MAYRAVFFDLFDTLVRFERDRLPEITIKGKTVRSTAGHLHGVLARHAPQVTLEQCYEALLVSWKEAERLRAIDHREVSARERFSYFFPAAGLDVAGAHGVGMDAAWINPEREALPAGVAPPIYEIRDLAELEAIVARA